MEGEFLFPVRAMNADPFLCLLLSCAHHEAVLFFSLVLGLAVATVGLQFVLLCFCRVLVMDHFAVAKCQDTVFSLKLQKLPSLKSA